VDTLLYQATDVTATVVGQRNPLGQRQGSIEVKVPQQMNADGPVKKDSLIAIAYWIGIGEPPITEYAALAEEVPPEWGQPGVSAPLAAYATGHPIVLPGLQVIDSVFQKGHVRFDFVHPQERKAFAQNGAYTPLIPRNSSRGNYGLLQGDALRDLLPTVFSDPELGKDELRFYFAFANQHQVNSYRVEVKVIGLYGVTALR
jgi:hypothetical protein